MLPWARPPREQRACSLGLERLRRAAAHLRRADWASDFCDDSSRPGLGHRWPCATLRLRGRPSRRVAAQHFRARLNGVTVLATGKRNQLPKFRICARARSLSAATSSPFRTYWPEFGRSSRPKIFIRVVLPEPERPRMATKSFCSMIKETFEIAGTRL